jgi:hypothetical protein
VCAFFGVLDRAISGTIVASGISNAVISLSCIMMEHSCLHVVQVLGEQIKKKKEVVLRGERKKDRKGYRLKLLAGILFALILFIPDESVPLIGKGILDI